MTVNREILINPSLPYIYFSAEDWTYFCNNIQDTTLFPDSDNPTCDTFIYAEWNKDCASVNANSFLLALLFFDTYHGKTNNEHIYNY